MVRPQDVFIPSGPVHLAGLLAGVGALGSILVAYELAEHVSDVLVAAMVGMAVGMLVSIWGLWRFKRWAWVGMIGLFVGLWLVGMVHEVWLAIFYSIAVVAYLVFIRELFLSTRTVRSL